MTRKSNLANSLSTPNQVYILLWRLYIYCASIYILQTNWNTMGDMVNIKPTALASHDLYWYPLFTGSIWKQAFRF